MNGLSLQTMRLAAEHFPPDLLGADGAEALAALAPVLAEDAWPLYFEVRLDRSSAAIDVSQHFFAKDGGAERLHALARRRAAAPAGEAAAAWTLLADFAARWPRDPGLAPVDEIGLEFDHQGGTLWSPVPAVFAAFAGGVLASREAAARFVAALHPAGNDALPHLLSALEAAGRHGMTPGRMIGLMLSRGDELRTMVHDARPDAIAAFLPEAGWRGPVAAMAALLSEPALRDARPKLVLGFAPALVEDCGIEIIHGVRGDPAERERLTGWLAGRGLADPARIAAAQRWQGDLTPLNAPRWPEALIVRDLCDGGRLDRFARWLNHVKLNVSGGRVRAAKTYLSLARHPVAGAAAGA